MFVETNQAIIALFQLSEEGENSWGQNNRLRKKIFLEKLWNEMSTESFETLQQIPGNLEVTQISTKVVAYWRKA